MSIWIVGKDLMSQYFVTKKNVGKFESWYLFYLIELYYFLPFHMKKYLPATNVPTT